MPRSRDVRLGDSGLADARRCHEDELTDVGAQLGLGLGRQADVGDQDVGLVETGEGADPDRSPLRVIGKHDKAPTGLDQSPVRLGLQEVRGGEAGLGVDPVDADENDVDLTVRRAATANWPTSASEGVRTPPVRMIVWPRRPAW